MTPAHAAARLSARLSALFRSRDNAGLAALAADLRGQADAMPRLAPAQPTRREAARRAFHKAAGFLFPAPF